MGSCFKCFFCQEYHLEVSSLLQHTTEHNVQGKKRILEKYVHKSKRCLQVDISQLKCKICWNLFKNLETVRSHLEKEHEKEFCPAGNGMTEYNMEEKNGMFSCHICGEAFHRFTLLNTHMNSHVGKVVCENCGESFLNQHLLMKHMESHLIRKLKCKHCDKMFDKRSQLKYHTEITHEGKDRVRLKKCTLCTKTFKEHYRKVIHMRESHGISKNYPCHVCKSNFSTRRAVTEHVTRFHTDKYKCDVCAKCFGIESKLKTHMIGHTGERNFICPICKNAYMHKMTLKKHMKSHSTEFKFVCSQCGAGFHNENEYAKHEQQEKQWHKSSETNLL